MLPEPELPPNALETICDFIACKVSRAGAEGVCLGLSGGADSAVAAALAVRALGADRVLALVLPDSATPDDDLRDAELLAQSLGIRHRFLDISALVGEIGNATPGSGGGPGAKGNLKARLRMLMIYHAANSGNMLVLGTGNRSEIMLGYFTKYGDGACDINPIGDLYKTQVWKLGAMLDLPEGVIAKEPTAGLVPGQTDRDELGFDYHVLDRILVGLESGFSALDIAAILGLDPAGVAGIAERVAVNAHKRRGPQVLKLTGRVMGTDLREPL